MVKLPAFELLQVNLQSLKHLTARTNLGTQKFRENNKVNSGSVMGLVWVKQFKTIEQVYDIS